MKNLIIKSILTLCLMVSNVFAGGMPDDPLITLVKVNQLESRDSSEGNLVTWDVDAWIGKDLTKFWIKLTGEQLDGVVESQNLDLLYNKAISAFWDLQVGVRAELTPEPTQYWIGAGFKGIAPYQLEMDINAFANENGLIHFSLNAEYEYMFSQRLILVPEFGFSIFSDDDITRGIESGLANVEIGLRLSYEIKREFAPYIGVNFEAKDAKKYDSQLLIGLRTWF